MNEVIAETKDYILTNGVSSNSSESSSCYQIKNKLYGVVEVETFMLPQALKWMEDIQAGLDSFTGSNESVN